MCKDCVSYVFYHLLMLSDFFCKHNFHIKWVQNRFNVFFRTADPKVVHYDLVQGIDIIFE